MTETVGERLKQARNERHMTMSEVQQISKVQVRYLEAIENDDFDQLPGPFYAKAFIKQFANAVGLDGQELVDFYEGKEREVEPPPPRYLDWDDEEEEEQEVVRVRRSVDKQEQTNYLPLFVLSFIALAILAGVLYITVSNTANSPGFKSDSQFTVDTGDSTSTSSKESSTSTSTTDSSSSSTSSSSSEEDGFQLKFASVEGADLTYNASNVTYPFSVKITTKPGVSLAFVSSPPSPSADVYPTGAVGVKGTSYTLDLRKDQFVNCKTFKMTFEVYDSVTRQYVEKTKENVQISINGKKVDLAKVTQIGRMSLIVNVKDAKESTNSSSDETTSSSTTDESTQNGAE